MGGASLLLYLTKREAAERVRLSIRTVERRIEAGELPVHKIGSSLRISERDLDEWAARHRVAATSDAA
jgi:excisionase family DNA binding protein